MTKRVKFPRSKARVFLSYAQEDQPVATRVERILAQATGQPIVIERPPRPQALDSRVQREFGDSDLYVLFLTPHTLKSDRVLVEMGAAWALKKPTLVVVADEQLELRSPLLEGLEVARYSVTELERPGVVEGILHQIAQLDDRPA